jgi:hypothetical protein
MNCREKTGSLCKALFWSAPLIGQKQRMNPSGHQNPPLISLFAGNFKGAEEPLRPKIDEISTLKIGLVR